MLPITSIFACLATMMYIVLAFRIIAIRRAKRISLGDGADPRLETRIRQHGNFNEYVPLTLILMGLAELQGAPTLLMIALGLALLASRIAHVVGLERMAVPIGLKLRTFGVLTCFAVLSVLVITLLAIALF
ncbi:MAPEG family protein [Pacificibacter marinus]|uniref:MAPEG family protein n=1 Tax=Pacificibacter marinus TaxID=658057 RepID=UPI001C069F42|nr:MAPEG family protein [Pacificibacter marinus]MBU2866948.1 MAPEG family protein [Pacificibacter marinus]